MAKFQTSKRPKMSRADFGSNLKRMFNLFAGQRKVLICTILMSILEAVMITFTTFCICIIYSNFFSKSSTEDPQGFLIEN